jgi:hypothetical protein
MASKCIRIFNPGGESPQCSTHRIFLSAKPLVLCVVLTSDPVITRASAPFGPLAPPAESYRADSIQTKPHGGETVFGLPSSFTYGLKLARFAKNKHNAERYKEPKTIWL